MKLRSRLGILGLVLIAMLALAPAVSAHPLGNFTINHFAGLLIAKNGVEIDYVLDMAEIPTFQEISLLDKNQNGKADPDELTGYPEKQCQSILDQLALQRNADPLSLSLSRSGISFPQGAGGLSTLRLTCSFLSHPVSLSLNDRFDFQDNSYSDRIGWREIVVTGQGIGLTGQFATESISKELTAYPQDMLTSPLNVREVNFQVVTGSDVKTLATGPTTALATSNYTVGGQSDRFTQLITLNNLTPAGILLALFIAFVWGGLHSLTPGHGKTIVGAYLVGSRGTAIHAVYLGLMTTLTHTAGVFLLGLITYFASRYILPEQLFPWISVLSGIMVIVIGISLATSRLRQAQSWKEIVQRVKKALNSRIQAEKTVESFSQMRITAITAAPVAHQGGYSLAAAGPHPHHEGEVHSHDGITFHTHGPDGHTHSHAGAITHSHGSAEHTHEHIDASTHSHVAGEHAHDHSDLTLHTRESGEHTHEHNDAGGHSHASGEHSNDHGDLTFHSHGHGEPAHSHLPPIDPGTKVTWRSLLALGISGGLLPCPSALVVLLGAIALNKIGFGIVLVLVFSLGLAGVLTGIGLILVYARKFFDRLPVHSRWIDLIPAGSAVFITILGIGITLQALAQMGWIRL